MNAYQLKTVVFSDLTHDLPDCNECQGEGFFIVAAGWDEERYERCSECGGAGKVDDLVAA